MSEAVLSRALGASVQAVGAQVHLNLVLHLDQKITFMLSPMQAAELAGPLAVEALRARNRRSKKADSAGKEPILKPSGRIL